MAKKSPAVWGVTTRATVPAAPAVAWSAMTATELTEPDRVEDETRPAPWGLTPVRVVVLLVAVAFLAGALGWSFSRAQTGSPSEDSVDVGFLHDMIDHHSQAVQMSSLLMRPETGADPSVVLQAQSIAFGQETEIGLMLGRLRAWDLPDSGDGTAMAWMGDPVPTAEMPGLATPAQIEELRGSTGRAADELFLRLMIVHHQAGVAMADTAAGEASNDDVVRLAEAMATAQRSEINEMAMVAEHLGIDLSDMDLSTDHTH